MTATLDALDGLDVAGGQEPGLGRRGCAGASRASRCWRRSGSTPWSSWRRAARWPLCAAVTPSTSWRSRRKPSPTSTRAESEIWLDLQPKTEHDNVWGGAHLEPCRAARSRTRCAPGQPPSPGSGTSGAIPDRRATLDRPGPLPSTMGLHRPRWPEPSPSQDGRSTARETRDGLRAVRGRIAAVSATGDRQGLANAIGFHGAIMDQVGDFRASGGAAGESMALFREIGDTANVASKLFNLGNLACAQADFARRPPCSKRVSSCVDGRLARLRVRPDARRPGARCFYQDDAERALTHFEERPGAVPAGRLTPTASRGRCTTLVG